MDSAARPGNEAEEVCANREAEQEAPENKLVNLWRQQSQKALRAVLKYGVRAGQLLHGQHQQAQSGGQREDDRKDDDRLTLFYRRRADASAYKKIVRMRRKKCFAGKMTAPFSASSGRRWPLSPPLSRPERQSTQ